MNKNSIASVASMARYWSLESFPFLDVDETRGLRFCLERSAEILEAMAARSGMEEVEIAARIIDPASFEQVRQHTDTGGVAPEDAAWRCDRARDKARHILAIHPLDVVSAGVDLLRALDRYGYPVSEAAEGASMSQEARALNDAAKAFRAELERFP